MTDNSNLTDSPAAEIREWRDFAFAAWIDAGEKVLAYKIQGEQLEAEKERVLVLADENQKVSAYAQELKAENEKLSQELLKLNQQLEYYDTSLSWRVTAPLRAARQMRG